LEKGRGFAIFLDEQNSSFDVVHCYATGHWIEIPSKSSQRQIKGREKKSEQLVTG
jgi:hypothetical protein